MRDDISEVIIERPRKNSRARYPRATRRRENHIARLDPDRLRSAEGIKRALTGRGSQKYLNENLAPLRRYLMRQVNRPWNKVWSEICALLRSDSTVQQHVRDHINDFVAIRTFMKDGDVWVAGDSVFRKPGALKESRVRLYVDPRCGLLRPNKHFKGRSQQRRELIREGALHMREVRPNVQVHRFGERGWWEVVLMPTTLAWWEILHAKIDVVLAARLSPLRPDELYGRHNVYAVAKRQLSQREVARLHVTGHLP
jgi:hypothetical protein